MKQTFIVRVETDKTNFNDWIEEHDKLVRADERVKVIDECIKCVKSRYTRKHALELLEQLKSTK